LKPMLAVAPVARLAFQSRLVAVTGAGPGVQVADQPEVKVCPDGRLNCRVQPLTGSPVLVMVMLAVKPPTPGLSVHGWAWYETEQPGAASAGDGAETTSPAAASAATPPSPRRR